MKKSKIRLMVELLNNKQYKELNINYKDIIKVIFPHVDEDDILNCYQFKGNKVDLIIVCKGVYKYISVRGKTSFFVFKGDLKILTKFLFSIGFSYNAVSEILSFKNNTYIYSLNNVFQEDIYYKNSILNAELKDKFKFNKLMDFLLVKEKNDINVDYFYFGNEKKGEVIDTIELCRNLYENKMQENNLYKIGPFNFMNSVYENTCVLKINLYKYKKNNRV